MFQKILGLYLSDFPRNSTAISISVTILLFIITIVNTHRTHPLQLSPILTKDGEATPQVPGRRHTFWDRSCLSEPRYRRKNGTGICENRWQHLPTTNYVPPKRYENRRRRHTSWRHPASTHFNRWMTSRRLLVGRSHSTLLRLLSSSSLPPIRTLSIHFPLFVGRTYV